MTEYYCDFCKEKMDENDYHSIYGNIHGLDDERYIHCLCPGCYCAFATGYKTALDQMEAKLRAVQEINPFP